MINKSPCFSITLWIKSKYISLAFRPLGRQQLSPSLLASLGLLQPCPKVLSLSPCLPGDTY